MDLDVFASLLVNFSFSYTIFLQESVKRYIFINRLFEFSEGYVIKAALRLFRMADRQGTPLPMHCRIFEALRDEWRRVI